MNALETLAKIMVCKRLFPVIKVIFDFQKSIAWNAPGCELPQPMLVEKVNLQDRYIAANVLWTAYMFPEGIIGEINNPNTKYGKKAFWSALSWEVLECEQAAGFS